MEALEPGTVPRELDPRRQPLDHRRLIQGCVPDFAPFPGSVDRCDLGQFMMDWLFDYEEKVKPE